MIQMLLLKDGVAVGEPTDKITFEWTRREHPVLRVTGRWDTPPVGMTFNTIAMMATDDDPYAPLLDDRRKPLHDSLIVLPQHAQLTVTYELRFTFENVFDHFY